MSSYTTDWFTGIIPSMLAAFSCSDISNQNFVKICEIGSYEGRSATWFYNNLIKPKNGHIWCLDTWCSDQELSDHNFLEIEKRFHNNIVEFKSHATILKGYSKDSLLSFYKNNNNPQWDLLFIDGSHTAEDVHSDLSLGWDLVRPGGVIFCDDYLWCLENKPRHLTPKLGIDAFESVYQTKLKLIPEVASTFRAWIKIKN